MTGSDANPQIPAGAFAQIADIASQEIVLCMIESLLSELSYCFNQKMISCDPVTEKYLAASIGNAFFEHTTKQALCLEDLLDALADTHRDIAGFIRRRFIYGENCCCHCNI